MKCKWIDCDKEARKKSPFCSGTCKKREQRASGTNVPVEVGQEPSGTKRDTGARPMNWGLPDCQCQHCQTARVNNSKNTINHGAWKSYADLADNEVNRVTLPGDVDYSGVALAQSH